MIFYFSATGNTLWAAKKTSLMLGETIVDIAEEMLSIANANGYDGTLRFNIADGESIGFFFPVHGWRPPVIVREFVRHIDFNGGKPGYTYVVCTAGDTVGEAVDIFKGDLSKSGLSVDSAISLLMPESYIGLPFMDVDNHKNEMRKKSEAELKLSTFVEDVRLHKSGINDITIGRWPRINSRLIGSIFTHCIVSDRPFRVDSEKCLRCGKCASLCPVLDIEGGKGNLPKWKNNGKCLSCFACYHHCPTKAIEYGHRTRNKGQYYYTRSPKM